VEIEKVHEMSAALEQRLGTVVRGQGQPIRDLVVALLAGGHVLLEGPPGLGKTLLVRTIAGLLRADYKRIQFTPDLMPADVTGTTIFRPKTGEFQFMPGPLFTQVLLADEINRTPPKTQAALLEAMQERQVTLDGRSHALPELFLVVATQNPIEFEGTYPLPEAQLDRFFMKVSMSYPNEVAEREILKEHVASLELEPSAATGLEPILGSDDVLAMRSRAAGVFVEDSVQEYVVRIVRASRDHRRVTLGASSRAAVVLMFAAKAAAASSGRDFVRPDDVKTMALAVLRHRLILRPEVEVEGIGADQVIADLLGMVEVPRGTPE